MSNSDTSVTTSATGPLYTGRVKWFNNKNGYGFLMVVGGDKEGSEIFVHHSSINVNEEQYRYLVQGEYVEFYLKKMDSGPHEYQASDVSGVKGGKLICETRHDSRKNKPVGQRQSKPETSTTTSSARGSVNGRGKGQVRGRARVQPQGEQRQSTRSVTRGTDENGTEWMLVRVRRTDLQEPTTPRPLPSRSRGNSVRGRGGARLPRQSKPQTTDQ